MLRQVLCLCIFVFVSFRPAFSLCPYNCDCQDEPTSCPAGVSLVMDGCNCCKICAKQLGQQCNGDHHVCDKHRNLFCDFTPSKSGDWGICRARSGRSCWNGSSVMTSGSMFQPSCKKRCWCMDGVIACIPTCPHEAHVPRRARCLHPHLKSIHGQCCDQWMCESPSGGTFPLPLDHFWNEYVQEDDEENSKSSAHPAGVIGNGVRDGAVYVDDVGENVDELRDFQLASYGVAFDEYTSMNTEESWLENNIIPGDIDAHLRAEKAARRRLQRCRQQASAWSPCTKRCGLGVSIRVTNNNPKCQLVREQRLCEIRPCRDHRYIPKKGRQCLRQKRSRKRMTLTYAGCVSVKKIKPRFCGSCHDRQKCCTPKLTRTSQLRFRCQDGRIISKKIQVVRSCHCHKNCALESGHGSVRFALFGDMHRVKHR